MFLPPSGDLSRNFETVEQKEEDDCSCVGIHTRNHRCCQGYGLPVEQEVSSSDGQKQKLAEKMR